MIYLQHILVFIAVISGAFLSYKRRKLTTAGSQMGVAIALLIYASSGLPGFLLLTGFFVLSVLATAWNRRQLKLIHDDEERDARQVFANGGVAAVFALSILMFPAYKSLFYLMMASSLAAATSDTLSSELGTIYGKRFMNVLTFKKDEKGMDGVISFEGTVIGLIASGLIAIIDALFNGFDLSSVIIIFAGFTGNLADSVIGAAFERNNLLSNNAVNFLNTLTGALAALFLFYYI